MRTKQPYKAFFWAGLLICLLLLAELFLRPDKTLFKPLSSSSTKENEWQAPSLSELPAGSEGELVSYGKSLIENTAHHLGPNGVTAALSNGMNCQNCHLKGGTQNFANPFSATAATYPRYRERSGRVESIAFRINECIKRSLNGNPLDSTSREMAAMIAYIKWVGKGVPSGVKPKGAGTEELPYLSRPADPQKGQVVYASVCSRCHGPNGQGLLLSDSSGYSYPPLWGEHSFNVSAGLYRVSSLAGFIKNNMPLGADYKTPQLTVEQAWDVAAFIASQPRPQKFFQGDWKDVSKKPVDYPFGPYADTFPEIQHKYGPFEKMKRKQ